LASGTELGIWNGPVGPLPISQRAAAAAFIAAGLLLGCARFPPPFPFLPPGPMPRPRSRHVTTLEFSASSSKVRLRPMSRHVTTPLFLGDSSSERLLPPEAVLAVLADGAFLPWRRRLRAFLLFLEEPVDVGEAGISSSTSRSESASSTLSSDPASRGIWTITGSANVGPSEEEASLLRAGTAL